MIYNVWYILCFQQYHYCRVFHVFLLGFSPTAVWGSVSLLAHLESTYSFVSGAHQIWGIYLGWFIYPWRHLRVSMWTSNVVMSYFKCFWKLNLWHSKVRTWKSHPRNKWYFIQEQVYLHFIPVNFTYIWRLFYLSDDAQTVTLQLAPIFQCLVWPLVTKWCLMGFKCLWLNIRQKYFPDLRICINIAGCGHYRTQATPL